MRIDHEKMKERMILDGYPEIKKTDTMVKRRVIKKLLEGDSNPDDITRKKVQEAIRSESAICDVVKALRKRDLLKAFESYFFIRETVDFRNISEDFEDVLKSEVESCIRCGRKDATRKLMDFFGTGIDFTDIAKKTHSYFIRLRSYQYADQVKELFPDIDFDS